MPNATEKAWAVALARDISSNIPEAVRSVPGLTLTDAQIAALRSAFALRLIRTMGEDTAETPGPAAGQQRPK
jgi:hypothetical protein